VLLLSSYILFCVSYAAQVIFLSSHYFWYSYVFFCFTLAEGLGYQVKLVICVVATLLCIVGQKKIVMLEWK